jgi:type III secretory pathway component EscR
MASNIYLCPECSQYSKNNDQEKSIYGLLQEEKLYTDDNLIIKLIFVKCPHCYEILDKEQDLIESHSWQMLLTTSKSKLNLYRSVKAQSIELNLMEYYEILSSMNLTKEQEINIRVQILVLENNKRRNNYNKDYDVPYNNNEIENFIALEKLLDLETGRFLVVEIKRYLKKFDESKEKLDRFAKILEKELRKYRDILDKEKLLIENEDIYVRSFLLSEVVKNDLKNIRM